MGQKRVNLKDVAKLANVSISTVSRAINDPNLVSQETLTLINNAITKLGFNLGIINKVDIKNRVITIRVLYANSKRNDLMNLVCELTARLSAHPINIVLSVIDPNDDVINLKEKRIDQADALLVLCPALSQKNIQAVQHFKLPIFYLANPNSLDTNNIQYILPLENVFEQFLTQNEYKSIYFLKSANNSLEVFLNTFLHDYALKHEIPFKSLNLNEEFILSYSFLQEYIPTHHPGIYISVSPILAQAAHRAIHRIDEKAFNSYQLLCVSSTETLKVAIPPISVINIDYGTLTEKLYKSIIDITINKIPSSNINFLDVYYIKRQTT